MSAVDPLEVVIRLMPALVGLFVVLAAIELGIRLAGRSTDAHEGGERE